MTEAMNDRDRYNLLVLGRRALRYLRRTRHDTLEIAAIENCTEALVVKAMDRARAFEQALKRVGTARR